MSNFNQHFFDETVVLRKKFNKSTDMTNMQRNGKVESVKKQEYTKNPNNMNNRKLDESSESERINKVEKSISKIIMQARLALSLSQKDLAQKINQKPQVIMDYENGKAIPNPQILGKMQRILKVKLLGKKETLGQPLNSGK